LIESDNGARKGLFSLGILLLVSGGAGLFASSDNLATRSLAVLAVVASAYLLRISGVRVRATPSFESAQRSNLNVAGSSMRLTWAMSLGLLPVLGISIYFMEADARHGYRQTWPVYAFAGVAVVCTVVWSYLASLLFGRQ